MIMMKKIITDNLENNSYNFDKILQYYTNEQILELLKDKLSELEYYNFLKSNIDENQLSKNTSIEEYFQNNISKIKLLNLIKDLNITIWNYIVTEMTNRIY